MADIVPSLSEAGRDPLTRITTSTGQAAWQVNGHATVRKLARDARLSGYEPGPASRRRDLTHAETAGDERVSGWARTLRKALSMERVESLRERVAAIAGSLLDDIVAGHRPPDLHTEFSLPFVARTACALLDVPETHGSMFREWWETAKAGSPREAAQARSALLRYVRELVVTRQQAPGDDVVSALATTSGPVGPSSNIVKFLASFVSKGQETPSNALDWTMVLLLSESGSYRRLVADRSLVEPAIEEVLRLFPVISGIGQGATGIRKLALADVDVDGMVLERGSLVLFNVVAANMDTNVFDDPGDFHMDRPRNPHLTFGVGPHSCPAAGLARLELTVAVNSLLDRLPTLRLAVDPAELRYGQRLTSQGFDALPVRW
jgi:pentalenic acid synthase